METNSEASNINGRNIVKNPDWREEDLLTLTLCREFRCASLMELWGYICVHFRLSLASVFVFYLLHFFGNVLILCIAVPQQLSSIGPSQQTVSKQETETKIEVVKPSDSDKSNSQASNSEDSAKTCSAKGSEQQKESEVVGVLVI